MVPPLPAPDDVALVLMAHGDADLLAQALEGARTQTRAHRLVVAVPSTGPGAGRPASLPADALVVTGASAPARRNAALDAVAGARAVVFADDDVVLRADHVEQVVRFLDEHPGVVALTGRVLLDGPALGRRVGLDEARAAVAAPRTDALQPPSRPADDVYPSAFAVRLLAADGQPLPERFDEALPGRAWLEGVDFGRRALRHGAVVHAAAPALVVRGLHVGDGAAQSPLGYAQVVHPLHLHRRGVLTRADALKSLLRPLVANAAGLRGGERPWRLQRLRGNLRGVVDVARGRVDPSRGERALAGQASAAR